MIDFDKNAYEYCHQCGMGVKELNNGLCLHCDEQNKEDIKGETDDII